MTPEQQRARSELACEVAPAIVWGFFPAPEVANIPGARLFMTDTVPSVALVVAPDGGVSTSLEHAGLAREVMQTRERELLRTVRDMVRMAALEPRAPFEVLGYAA